LLTGHEHGKFEALDEPDLLRIVEAEVLLAELDLQLGQLCLILVLLNVAVGVILPRLQLAA
jgi:hypothetical protein